MKINGLLVAVMALAATSAFAAPEDTDGNGTFSKEEMVAAYPELTDEQFGSIDANADGAVDADELAAAVAAGTVAE